MNNGIEWWIRNNSFIESAFFRNVSDEDIRKLALGEAFMIL